MEYGRTIWLEKDHDDKIKMTFVRFVNKILKNKFKYMGFELIDMK